MPYYLGTWHYGRYGDKLVRITWLFKPVQVCSVKGGDGVDRKRATAGDHLSMQPRDQRCCKQITVSMANVYPLSSGIRQRVPSTVNQAPGEARKMEVEGEGERVKLEGGNLMHIFKKNLNNISKQSN